MTPNGRIGAPAATAEAVARRQAELGSLLQGLSASELRSPTLLPEWDRLTVVCHLRYGAEATLAMTQNALAGKPAAFYPEGRAVQREATLRPRAGENPSDVVTSYVAASERLSSLWSTLAPDHWDVVVTEPDDNPDLGPITVHSLAVLRLTEVEVHGTDLDIGATEWSKQFVETALAMRLRRLPQRYAARMPRDPNPNPNPKPNSNIDGTWVLTATDGPSFTVTVTEGTVVTGEGGGEGAGRDPVEGAGRDPVEGAGRDPVERADARIAGTSGQLLAFLLGRISPTELAIDGSEVFASRFLDVFPPP